MNFEVIPAVDILDGKCVRLEKGNYEKVTVYSEDPVSMAKKWQDQGYRRIHLVDLDGAREGVPSSVSCEIHNSIFVPPTAFVRRPMGTPVSAWTFRAK